MAEKVFIGILSGLIIGIFFYFTSFIDEIKKAKKDEKDLLALDTKVNNKGGLWKIFPELYSYLKKTFNIYEESNGLGSISVMRGDNYEITFMLYGEKYDTICISIRNCFKNKTIKKEFKLDNEESFMIQTLETAKNKII